ncbi:MAG TPA: hypothetical protein VMS43_11395 [Allosphingosinicella sp.]|nr:hypothetical protein [Allosphingosinicella sp.]
MLETLLLVLALAAPAAAPAPSPGWRLTPDGYGPARIGMTPAQVSQVLAIRLEGDAIEDEGACVEKTAVEGYRGFFFMFENGRLSRISATEPSQAVTALGLGMGATATQVRRAYGPALRAETHAYHGRPAEYLTFWPRRNARGIRFETGPDRRVETIHVGGAAIRYIEGCA